jgi:MFS family permease
MTARLTEAQRSASSRDVFGAPVFAWVILAVLFAVTILSYTDRYVFNILAEQVRRDLHLTDAQLGLIQGTSFALSYSVAALALVRWADTLPRYALLIVGFVTWSVGTLWCGLAHSFEAIIGARILVGLGEASLFPAIIPLVSDLFPPHRRGFAVSLLIIASFAASGVALVVTGSLLQALESAPISAHVLNIAPWRAVLIILGGPAIILSPLLMLIRSHPSSAPSTNVEPSDSVERRGDGLAVALLLAGLTAWAFVSYGQDAWFPTNLIRAFAITSEDIAQKLGTASLIAGVLGPLIGGLAGDQLQQSGLRAAKPMIAFVAAVIAVPTLLWPLAATMMVRILLYAIYTLLTGIASTAVIAAIQDVAPPGYRGRAMAIQGFLYTAVGLGLGPYSVARVSDRLAADGTALGPALVSVGTPVLSGGLVLLLFAWLRTRSHSGRFQNS